ncbi:amino acid ABC transporter permease [Peptacetobacter sp.]|uniref:amino acid ABC transporter permease n=1 Tax=Peptacetobacter sp. TaxID=2991975 RepID=UPI00261C74FF|nr:amino acid ABC transporter permease [Peptacetobacter sp.]MEE0450671.1 amino acid ABC transporter permease [Peptacetobacter sp.]
MRFDFNFFLQCFPALIAKIPFTLYLGIISFVASMALAIVILIIRNSKISVFRWFAELFVSFFRSTPYITQLFIFYYGLPQLIPSLVNLSAETSFVISVALNSSAFIVEILRGGLLSVDKGQREAALSIGLNKFQVMTQVVIPQAFVSILPALGNTFVGAVKNTAIAFTIGVVEILSESKILAARGFNYMEAYIAAGIVYWILILAIDLVQKRLEKRVCKFL